MSTDPADPAAAARRQQQVQALCAPVVRAFAGERDLQFRGQQLHRGRRPLPPYAPHLHPSLEDDDLASFRGAADGLGLRLAHSDDALHRTLAPTDAVAHAVFSMLEQYRVESFAGDDLPGARHNLQHRFEQWSLALRRLPLVETQHGLLLYAVAQAGRARVLGLPVDDATADLIEGPRGDLAAAVGPALAALRRSRHDQAAFARHAAAVARWVAQQLAGSAADDANPAAGDGDGVAERLAFGLRMPFGDEGDDAGTAAATVGTRGPIDLASRPYHAFTTAYDREAHAASLLRPGQLAELRAALDARLAAQGLNPARLARELQALLSSARRDDWIDAQEEGLIDGRRLAGLVASPTERRLFRHEQSEPQADAVVSFLIDCSGSMRAHAQAVATLVDLFARAIDLAGATSEVLGFTTGAWNGGRAMRDWLHAGRPPRPGRLNEALHLVFKDADTPWRRARRDIAALLKPDLFREGIDGEALAWAARRLAARPEQRRLLIVICDGCPMDAATQRANGAQFLGRHLQDVAAAIEASAQVELAAVGVGLDLSPTFSAFRAIDLAGGSGRQQIGEVLALLGPRRRCRPDASLRRRRRDRGEGADADGP